MVTQQEAPQLEVEESTPTYARVVVRPLPRGFGVTLGNTLRRVLLSSLPGAAVTTVRIEDARELIKHEFSTVYGMAEDVTEFLLNVKEIRLRGLSDRPGKMFLDVQGEGNVTAGMISVSADYEIVNPELHLATLDEPDARLQVEFTVERGTGYQPATAVAGLAIGVMPVDAIFTPVRKASFTHEPDRVGQEATLERLMLEVWTDGSLSGQDAVAQAADILMHHFGYFTSIGRTAASPVDRGLGSTLALPPDRYNMPIEDLNLSVRAHNCLKRAGLMTVGQVLDKSEEELLALRNFGRKSYEELRQRLVEVGFLDKSVLEREIGAAFEEEEELAEEQVAAPPRLQPEEPQPAEKEVVLPLPETGPEEIGPIGLALKQALRSRKSGKTGGEEA